jgi:serine phosphatase RsbU (regulator of sigma subunit)
MGSAIRLPARIAIAVGAGAVLVALGVALLLANTIELRNDAGATIDTNRYLAALTDVERLVVDAETGLRGYVITTRSLFLQPLNAAVARFPQAAAALAQAAMRERALAAQAQGLVQASRAYLTGYVPGVLALARHDPRSARTLAVTLEGKRLVDGVRARTGELESAVSARQIERQRAARHAADHAVAESIAVLVALTVLTVLLGGFLGRLALARDRARARSERTAAILQRSLLPPGLPAVPGCELSVRFKPAGEGELVGGDFYDVFAVGDRWAIVLGDVCGKGAEAAAVTAMARWTLRSCGVREADPGVPLRFLNDSMLRQDLDGRFITIAYLLLSVERDCVRVGVACAGHPAPLYVPLAGEPMPVDARGDLLGVWDEVSLRVAELELMAGDAVVVYTDGVTDEGPHVSYDAPVEILRERGPDPSAERLASLVERYANERQSTQRDDIAILALRFRGEGGERAARPDSHDAGMHAAASAT